MLMPASTRATIWAALAALLMSAVLIANAAPPANSTGQYRDFFRGLMRPDTGTSCCDESDGRLTEARLTSDGWQARTPHGDWVAIPNEKILRGKTNPTGHAILFWLPSIGVMCFLEPPLA